jgi:23S rRNA pseudouridine1911/1915/1917 synthase
VHRLDKETSGLILIARNDKTHEALAEMFANRANHQDLHRAGAGQAARGWGDHPDPDQPRFGAPHPHDHAPLEGARHAVSHYRVVERLETRFGPFTLARVRIETGRTHQIRVHMASISTRLSAIRSTALRRRSSRCPLSTTRKAAREVLELGRNFLHCCGA